MSACMHWVVGLREKKKLCLKNQVELSEFLDTINSPNLIFFVYIPGKKACLHECGGMRMCHVRICRLHERERERERMMRNNGEIKV